MPIILLPTAQRIILCKDEDALRSRLCDSTLDKNPLGPNDHVLFPDGTRADIISGTHDQIDWGPQSPADLDEAIRLIQKLYPHPKANYQQPDWSHLFAECRRVDQTNRSASLRATIAFALGMVALYYLLRYTLL